MGGGWPEPGGPANRWMWFWRLVVKNRRPVSEAGGRGAKQKIAPRDWLRAWGWRASW
jgi:hypothetical protein